MKNGTRIERIKRINTDSCESVKSVRSVFYLLTMLTSDFNYHLPLELIAQSPADPRDSSRLMVVNKSKQTIEHRHFFDIVDYLGAGDLLVWNNSKVFKARLQGEILLDENVITSPPHQGGVGLAAGGGLPSFVETVTDDKRRSSRQPIGGQPHLTSPLKGEEASQHRFLNTPLVEIFLVRPMENNHVWKVLAKPGKKLRLGMKVKFADDFEGEVIAKETDGTLLMQFADEDMVVREKANKYGEVPTPPYIRTSDVRLRTSDTAEDRRLKTEDQYQTVYAKHEGSVAAPTAGFHFTPELIEKLKNKGVQFAEVTLHVGLGTFLPVKTKNVEEHIMHSEQVELTAKNADLINAAKAEGRRVIAVGTTTVRTLEGIHLLCHSEFPFAGGEESKSIMSGRLDPSVAPLSQDDGWVRPYTGDLNLFITPGFKFQIVDALITNFHLPKSTLLMLVAAFAGDTQFMLKCYEEAIKEKYRFYSFGDAMLIF